MKRKLYGPFADVAPSVRGAALAETTAPLPDPLVPGATTPTPIALIAPLRPGIDVSFLRAHGRLIAADF
jgi:hypothetical protein